MRPRRARPFVGQQDGNEGRIASNASFEAAERLIHARAGGGRIGGKPPAPPSKPGGLPSGDNPSPNKVMEQAFQRGKLGTGDEGFLSRATHAATTYLKETFIPQHELRGKDVIAPGKSRTRFFAPVIDRIRTLHGQTRNAKEEARKTVTALFQNLDPKEYDIVNRYLWARDAHENVLRGMEHRPGFNAKTVAEEVNYWADKLKDNPDAQLAVDSYKRLMNAIAQRRVAHGLMSGENMREWYYPHMLVDFIAEQPKKVNVGFGGLRYKLPGSYRKRKGSARDVNTQLIDTMERYITDDALAIRQLETLKEIGSRYDIRHNPKSGFTLGERDQIPAGYTKYDISRGFSRLRAGSVAERYLAEMIDFGGLDELAKHYGLDPVEFRKSLETIGITDPGSLANKLGSSKAASKPGPEYIIPEELARTLESSIDQMNKAELRGLSEKGVRAWKTLVLNAAPVRYNVRNLIGDVQRMYVQFGNDAFDTKVWSDVFRSVHNYYRKGEIDGLMQDMLDGGVTSSTRIQSEYALSDINPHLRQLEHGLDTSNLKLVARKIARVMSVIPETSAAREDIVRGVVLEMNKRRLARGDKPLTGAVDRELVRGLMDAGEARRAVAYISRESLLDYGNFTQRENRWRNGVLPFYAWAKGNFKFWNTIAKRTFTEGLKGDTGDQLARGSATAMMKGVAVTGVVLGTLRAWNDLVMGEWEEHLPENIKKTSHFIVPDMAHWKRTGEFRPLMENGRVTVWQSADALDDFMTMLGLDTVAPEAMSVVRGTLTREEMWNRQREHAGWGKGAARSLLNQIGPREQLLTQGVLGKRLFPDPLNPSDIPPEQRLSSIRDVLGLGAIPGVEGIVGAAHPGGDVFQPTTKVHDIPRQLGLRSVQEPTILQEGGFAGRAPLTPYEADLVKRIQQKQFELRDLEGRMKRELEEKANRQITGEQRDVNFQQRMLALQRLVDDIKMLAERLRVLQRSDRFQTTNPQ